MKHTRIAWLALAAAAAACTTRRETARLERRERVSDSLAPLAAAAPARIDAMAIAAPSRMAAPGGGFLRLPPLEPSTDLVIRSGQAGLEVDSLERAVARVRALAEQIGGYVANTALQAGRNELRWGSLEVRIPAERFEDGVSGLAAIGRLESVNVTANDVGEEFVDVAARMENARHLEARLLDLVATRAGKLADVLEVERELARVREEIERYDGRLRYLRAHAALSTLTVRLHEPPPLVGQAGTSVLGEAFKQAWRNFVALVAWLVRALGVVVPLGGLALGVWALLGRWRARARAGTAAA